MLSINCVSKARKTPAAAAQNPPTTQVAFTIFSTLIPETSAKFGLSETARIPFPIFVLDNK